jgi:hypothetical protein
MDQTRLLLTSSSLVLEQVSGTPGTPGPALSGMTGSGTTVSRAYWRFRRSQDMFLVNFGSSTFQGTGRYSMWSLGISDNDMQRRDGIGTRCVVKLDE